MEKAKQKKTEWLNKYGFNADGITFIYKEPGSYEIRNELKKAGFLFHPVLHWHAPAIPASYEDKVISISVDSVVEFAAWGEGLFKPEGKQYVYRLLQKEELPSTSEWVGEVGKSITFIGTVVRKTGYNSQFGYQNVYTFNDEEGNVFTWFTAKTITNEGKIKVIAKVKEHKEYKGTKQTIITRAKVEDCDV